MNIIKTIVYVVQIIQIVLISYNIVSIPAMSILKFSTRDAAKGPIFENCYHACLYFDQNDLFSYTFCNCKKK